MITADSINPFVPGYAVPPQPFVGREDAKETLEEQIDRLRTKQPIPRKVVISAPRGNGKTALLNWLEKEIRENHKKDIDIIQITPNQIAEPNTLLKHIKIDDIWKKIKKIAPQKASINIRIPNTPINITPALEWRQTEKTDNFIEKTRARCKTKPLILTIDEAHTINKEAGHALINAAQKISSQSPFLLILAGTPNLEGKLNDMDVTFWNRSAHIKPDLLSEEDTILALREPFQKLNITFDQKTLDSIVEDTKGYPHFIQVWGNELFKAIKKNQASEINKTIQQNIQSRVNTEKGIHYETYAERLAKKGLIPIALKFNEIFKSESTCISNQQTLNYIKRKENISSDEKAINIRDELRDIGYIWPGKLIEHEDTSSWHWTLAIPSLTKHLEIEYGKANTKIHNQQNTPEQ